MTKREALEIMLKMWDYIALNGCNKQAAIYQLGLPDKMDADCSCCEYAGFCDRCPVEWPATGNHWEPCTSSYWGSWSRLIHKSIGAKGYARKIANLALNALNKDWPEKEGL